MHIDPAPEEQEIPVIEEPEDPEPELQQEEYPQAAPDFTAEEANPSEEGDRAEIKLYFSRYGVPLLCLAWVEELVITGSEPSHDSAMG
ncbi:hypothetical protein U9M48_004809 [Paspalum notatum var. saurae]|uniref:Uncharacterized protein n=1 Tax=Paspalum notatum var. saurae TaxID=547442 RepID=A0AAQ3PU10_PASNO